MRLFGLAFIFPNLVLYVTAGDVIIGKKMNRKFKRLIFLLAFFIFAFQVSTLAIIGYKYGVKPDLSQKVIDQDVQTAFADWLTRYVTDEGCPKGTLRIHRHQAYDFDTVSEGIGWGMLITVLVDDNDSQKYFDGFWRYYKHYLNDYGLMSWQIDKKGKVIGLDSATEADENVAMALLYADQRWQSSGEINYLKEAKDLIAKILSFEVEASTYVVKGGGAWGGSSNTNPAYFDPAYYKVWLNFDKDWQKVSDRSFEIYDIFYNKYETGLFPDWCNIKGAPTNLSYDYKYDACQVPLKLGLNYLWWGEGGKYLEKFNDWLIKETAGEPLAIVDGYRLDGSVIGKYHNAAFVGPMVVSAMVSKKYQKWLNKLYLHLVGLQTGGRWGYYQDTLRLISMVIIAGKMPPSQ
ncbi:MAG: hypothetical protein KJ811_00305 [Candidatus Margulisbacteria bacterium]|nr:hypothetical protein [Candidatus Margulisiibacteriota bacterium]